MLVLILHIFKHYRTSPWLCGYNINGKTNGRSMTGCILISQIGDPYKNKISFGYWAFYE